MRPLFRRSPKNTIAALYGTIVAQARCPVFYEGLGVADTVLGRFDMVVLHLVLLLRRLRKAQATELVQGLFDAFCRDIDDNLREMGISDQGVPRQMRKVGAAFYGRANRVGFITAASLVLVGPAEANPAAFLADIDGPEAELGRLADRVAREDMLLVPFRGERSEHWDYRRAARDYAERRVVAPDGQITTIDLPGVLEQHNRLTRQLVTAQQTALQPQR